MTFVRCSLLTLCFTALLACVAPRIVPAPRVHAQPNQGQQLPAQVTAPAPATSTNSRRLTLCPPTSSPRPSPSAASATSWTLSARSGAWPFSGCCSLPRRGPPRGLGAAHLSPPLDSGTGLLRRLPGHHHIGQLAARLVQPARRKKLWHQRAGLGKLARRPGQGAGALAALRRADPAALQLDRAPLAAPLLAGHLGRHAAAPRALHLSWRRCLSPSSTSSSRSTRIIPPWWPSWKR